MGVNTYTKFDACWFSKYMFFLTDHCISIKQGVPKHTDVWLHLRYVYQAHI